MSLRPPDRVIGERYLHRWHLLPRNKFFNIYLHHFIGSDDDRALHDHPFASVSFLLKGHLFEVFETRFGTLGFRRIRLLLPVFRRATHAHRLIVPPQREAWTIFITGPAVRRWGFLCPQGWRHWREFVDESGNGIGRGCE